MNKLLKKIKTKIKPDYNSLEYLRSRGVKIGENVNLYNTNIDFGHGFLVTIGNNVTLTGVHILAHDASTQIPLGVSKVGRVNIGDNVFVEIKTIILPGVNIGNNVIIGAGSVVSQNIPSNSVAAGNPAKIICSYSDFVAKHKKNMETAYIYDTYWADKTKKQKKEMFENLSSGGIGYDK